MKLSSLRLFRSSIVTCVLFAATVPCTHADDFQARFEQRRREFEQRRQEIQAKQAEMVRQMHSQRGSLQGSQGYQTGLSNLPHHHIDTSSIGTAGRTRGSSIDPLPFNAKTAPSPDLCFLKFVQTVNSASSLDQVLSYLPYAQQQVLKGEQERWSPQSAAENRAQHLKLDPKTSAETLDFLTQAPYTRELKQLKDIGEKVMRVRNIKYTAPNRAVLDIATRSELRSSSFGKEEIFPYGTATVEMLGQGNFWMFDKYKDDGLHYKSPQ